MLLQSIEVLESEGRRAGASQALLLQHQNDEGAVYVDVAKVKNKDAYVAAAVAATTGKIVTSCSVRTRSASQAEEMAILAARSPGVRTILSDSKTAIRSFSRGAVENRRLVQDRARLTKESINGIRHVVSYGKRFDPDPSSFSITPEVLKVVRNSKKKYSERLALEKEQSAKRPREEPEAGPNSEGQDLQKEVETAKKMLTNDELLIAHGLKTKDLC
ncbi:hypothetical protein MRX96_025713 [Rhipicephalus microplus]